jgi:hypothetical protein
MIFENKEEKNIIIHKAVKQSQEREALDPSFLLGVTVMIGDDDWGLMEVGKDKVRHPFE